MPDLNPINSAAEASSSSPSDKKEEKTPSLIKLRSSDGVDFPVALDVAKQSGTIKNMLEDLGVEGEGDSMEEPVPLPNVTADILGRVVKWAEHHREDPPKGEDKDAEEKRTDNIPAWDVDFLKVDQATLFELILAANYLNVEGLLDVTCKTVAGMMKGKTPEEIRKTFNIVNDLTPEEEEAIRKENEWCEEK